MSEQFYEDKKVLSVEDGSAEGTKRVILEDTAFDVPAWEAEMTLSETVSSASDGRNNRAIHVAGEILKLLLSLNVRAEEVGFYLQKVVNSLKQNEQVAITRAFGYADPNDVRLADWDSMNKLNEYYENRDLHPEQSSGAQS